MKDVELNTVDIIKGERNGGQARGSEMQQMKRWPVPERGFGPFRPGSGEGVFDPPDK